MAREVYYVQWICGAKQWASGVASAHRECQSNADSFGGGFGDIPDRHPDSDTDTDADTFDRRAGLDRIQVGGFGRALIRWLNAGGIPHCVLVTQSPRDVSFTEQASERVGIAHVPAGVGLLGMTGGRAAFMLRRIKPVLDALCLRVCDGLGRIFGS